MLQEGARTTVVVTDAIVASSEIIVIAMAGASVNEIACMRLNQYDMVYR